MLLIHLLLPHLQALQQRLIFEPLSEHQERYAEDGVQPIDREDAVTLTELLDKSLPVGSIQVVWPALPALPALPLSYKHCMCVFSRAALHLCTLKSSFALMV